MRIWCSHSAAWSRNCSRRGRHPLTCPSYWPTGRGSTVHGNYCKRSRTPTSGYVTLYEESNARVTLVWHQPSWRTSSPLILLLGIGAAHDPKGPDASTQRRGIPDTAAWKGLPRILLHLPEALPAAICQQAHHASRRQGVAGSSRPWPHSEEPRGRQVQSFPEYLSGASHSTVGVMPEESACELTVTSCWFCMHHSSNGAQITLHATGGPFSWMVKINSKIAMKSAGVLFVHILHRVFFSSCSTVIPNWWHWKWCWHCPTTWPPTSYWTDWCHVWWVSLTTVLSLAWLMTQTKAERTKCSWL